MKTRQGFVSNSSSSSFVILGIRSKDEALSEKVERASAIRGTSLNTEEGGFILGSYLGRCTDGDELEVSLDELNTKAISVADVLGVHVKDIKLFAGESYS